ncbi:uncharacterized protein [Linepithema humile]|uniref:uncharacterized protein isoform X2 n=1 Tax=Linepithema humile TaxID=83485 RepID=UPI00062399CE|nr:PREDICTED: uncharacterized protein LOC105672937 [Linepithema humile]
MKNVFGVAITKISTCEISRERLCEVFILEPRLFRNFRRVGRACVCEMCILGYGFGPTIKQRMRLLRRDYCRISIYTLDCIVAANDVRKKQLRGSKSEICEEDQRRSTASMDPSFGRIILKGGSVKWPVIMDDEHLNVLHFRWLRRHLYY